MNGKEECRGIPCYFVSLSEGRYKWNYTYHVISFSNESTATAHSTCQGSTDPLMSKYCNRTTWLKKDLSRLFLFGSPRSPHARILKQIFSTWQSIVRLKRKWRGKMIARISVSFSCGEICFILSVLRSEVKGDHLCPIFFIAIDGQQFTFAETRISSSLA